MGEGEYPTMCDFMNAPKLIAWEGKREAFMAAAKKLLGSLACSANSWKCMKIIWISLCMGGLILYVN